VRHADFPKIPANTHERRADAFRFLARESVLVSQLADLVKAPREELADRVAAVVGKLRDAEKEIARMRAGAVLEAGADLAAGAAEVNGIAVVTSTTPEGTGADDLRKLAADVRGRLGAETWSARQPACSAVGAAARTTWLRAAAPSPLLSTRRCALSPRGWRRAGDDARATRRADRRRRWQRPGRGRGQ